jgi:hypothetical protein
MVKYLKYAIKKHGIDPEQAESQAGRPTKDLVRYDPKDPIRGEWFYTLHETDPNGPPQGVRVMGGHHRLNELYNRYERGEISGELEVPIKIVPWEP